MILLLKGAVAEKKRDNEEKAKQPQNLLTTLC